MDGSNKHRVFIQESAVCVPCVPLHFYFTISSSFVCSGFESGSGPSVWSLHVTWVFSGFLPQSKVFFVYFTTLNICLLRPVYDQASVYDESG